MSPQSAVIFGQFAVTFSNRCGGPLFSSEADAQILCQLNNEFLATPRTAAEFAQVAALNPAVGTAIGGIKPAGSALWRWAYGPYADTVFHIGNIGDIIISPPWKAGATLNDGPFRFASYAGSGEWDASRSIR